MSKIIHFASFFYQFISAYFLDTFIDTRAFLQFPYYRSQRQSIVATLHHTKLN